MKFKVLKLLDERIEQCKVTRDWYESRGNEQGRLNLQAVIGELEYLKWQVEVNM